MDRTLSLLVKFTGMDRLSGPLRAMTGGAKHAAREMAGTKKEIIDLERQAAKVAGLKTLGTQASKTFDQLDEARRKVRNLNLAIAACDGPMGTLKRQLVQAEGKVNRLTDASTRQTDRLAKLRHEAKEAGIDVGSLARAESRLTESLAAANRKMDEQVRKSEILAKRQRTIARAGEFGGKIQGRSAALLAAGATAGVGVTAVARPAIGFQSSMADVRKVVTGTPEQVKQLENNIIDLSRNMPLAADGIAAIVAAGAQAGVPRKELVGFASDATKMGIAFDLSADEAGTTMAAWRNAFGMDRGQIRDLADQVNYLGNTAGAKSSVITDIVTRIGPLGAVGGLAAGQIAAMGATLAGMGIESEIAATGIKNTMLALTKGESATKDQTKAFKTLGLETTDVARRMQKDAGGTIMDVMARIGRLSKDKQAGLMTDLFGSESIAAIAPMLTQLPTLAKNFDRVGNRAKYAGSMQAEYAGVAATTANRLVIMNNRVDALKIRFGERLLPTIERGAEMIGNMADRMSAWSQRHPELSAGIGKLAIGLTIIAGVLGSVGIAFGGVLPWIVRGAMFLARFGGMAMWVVRALALVGAAIGWPAVALVALVAGLTAGSIAIYNHWGQIMAFFKTLPAWFKNIGQVIMKGLLAGLKAMFPNLYSLASSVVGLFSFGRGTPPVAPAGGGRGGRGMPPVQTVPAVRSAGRSVTNHNQYHVKIEGGGNPTQQASEFMAAIKREQERKGRSSYQDND